MNYIRKFDAIKKILLLCCLLFTGFNAMAGYGGKTTAATNCNDYDKSNVNKFFPHSQTPEPDNENFKSDTICEFNVWSWQMFLWLTQEVGEGKTKQPRFLTFKSPYDVLNIESREVLKPSTGHDPFDEVVQAGPDGILVDQNNNVVYYSQYLNNDYIKFINTNNLTDPKAVQAFDAKATFPISALELKASWRIVEKGENTNDVFTMQHEVYGLKSKGNKIVIDANNIRTETLALVGFHIGGVVKDHPEMIWATFEHNKNAPIVPASFTPNTVIADKGDYTFFNTNPSKSTPQLTNTYASCNKNYINSPYMKLDKKAQKMQPVTQVCLQYKHGNMANYNLSTDDDINKAIQKQIVDTSEVLTYLNTLVAKNLNAEKDVWANYRQIGSIWFKPKNALVPGQNYADDFINQATLNKLKQDSSSTKVKVGSQLLIGSMALSNSTIETYTQFASTENNCFRCHNTSEKFIQSSDGTQLTPLKPMNINISHAFMNIYTWAQEMARNNKKK